MIARRASENGLDLLRAIMGQESSDAGTADSLKDPGNGRHLSARCSNAAAPGARELHGLAMNAVELLRREIELRPAAEDRELACPEALLCQHGSPDGLDQELAVRIRNGLIDIRSSDLLD
ncbi:DUF6285 domain-containing protein [Sphingomonas sp. IC-11]|uniref:DUF6285 domain-containing protein n=1 Tax=Sphingomonas sp. IC-11 TaxID=2898528 RepID=UPI001E37FB2A|nr:DUF6285 domain-containing protein [Sphingomonas sp. IC-11]MCD2317284.1 DUF6285 domain-containing protein [Sphingomonas sp. IC-11]